MADFQLPPEYEQEIAALQRRRQMAELLQQQMMQMRGPQQMGPVASKMNPLQPLLQVLGTYMNSQSMTAADKGIAGVKGKYEKDVLAERESIGQLPPAEQIARALASRFAPNQQWGKALQTAQKDQAQMGHWSNQDKAAVGKLEVDEKRLAADAEYKKNYLSHLEGQRQEAIRNHDLQAADRIKQRQLEAQRIGIDQQRLGLEGQRVNLAREVADRKADPSVKPLPPVAIKLQQEGLEDIGIAGSINSDIGALKEQLETGKLKLSLPGNLMGQAKNFVGWSDENSRNLASAKATLEKMRNDSLRLNKGTQTEGDAVRAWNELFANLNDQKVVTQRLGEIQKINQRAADLKKVNIDTLRSNYGHGPLETGQQFRVPPAVGGGGGKRLVFDPATGEFKEKAQ